MEGARPGKRNGLDPLLWRAAMAELSPAEQQSTRPQVHQAFLSALAWTVYSLLGRSLLEEYSPLLVTTYAALAGLAMLLPFLLVDGQATIAVFSDARALLLMFFLGLIGSAISFLWYSQAMHSIGAVGTAVYINLTPIFGVIAASVFLGEKSSQAVLLGGAMVCASLMLVNRPRWPWTRTARDAPPVVP